MKSLGIKEKASVWPTVLSICWKRTFRQHEEGGEIEGKTKEYVGMRK